MDTTPIDLKTKSIDLKGTIKIIRSVPGLLPLIFFNTFNNFVGGVFMALMDAYGLSLVPVQTWGFIWSFLSLAFVIGGLMIAKRGVGNKPIKTLFKINIILWLTSAVFTLQASIYLLVAGLFIWMALVPYVEAIEQTILQKVVPYERQGRVFGFAQSVEQLASPLTAFFIGPVTQIFFIPFMTTGKGVELIGSWYGVGQGRGIGLVFTIAGILGLIITLFSMKTKSYKLLEETYLNNKSED
jgi:DHA3 family multidrug efflux protein-like MFS transporter